MRVIFVLLLAGGLLTAIGYLRGPEYDEAYSIFLTAGVARPDWPVGVFQVASVRHFYAGTATFLQIVHNLRTGDVHPPLYFFGLEIWRHVVGPSWFAARMLSMVFTIGTLGVLGWLAAMAEVPVVAAVLVALLSYGFAYTGVVARGFALAQFFNVAGVALIYAARGKIDWRYALAGGVALGAAGFSNYLAVFTGMAALAWIAAASRDMRIRFAAAAGFAVFLPGDAYFFLVQRASRVGQFMAFSWQHAIALLAKDYAATLYGGLPLYAPPLAPLIVAGLAALSIACAAYAWGRRGAGWALFAMAAVATPVGLLALGLVFHNTPIEIRYLAFCMPFAALLLARIPRPLQAVLVTVQAAAIVGLAVAPVTMQRQAAAAAQAWRMAGADGLILLPFGNDGVGIPGPFLASLPDAARVELVRAGTMPDLAGERRVVEVRLGMDDASRAATAQMDAMLGTSACWRAVNAKKLAEEYKFTCGN